VTALDPWAIAADVIDPAPNPHVHEPVTWVTDRTREWTWSKPSPPATGPAKASPPAASSPHFIDAHPEYEAFVVTSAPTDPQVKAILWREIHQGPQEGRTARPVTQDAHWKIGDELVAFGRKPADVAGDAEDETVTAFQGIHARFVLVVFDEASGIPKQLWTAGNSLLTNDDARFLAIGNPDDPSSEFARDLRRRRPDHRRHVEPRLVCDPDLAVRHAELHRRDVPDELRPVPAGAVAVGVHRRHGAPACGQCNATIRTGPEWDDHERRTRSIRWRHRRCTCRRCWAGSRVTARTG
jgi:hypothetical protein